MSERQKKERVYLTISSSRKLNEAVAQAAERRGQSTGEFVRQVLAEAIGKPELAEEIKMGRPRLDG